VSERPGRREPKLSDHPPGHLYRRSRNINCECFRINWPQMSRKVRKIYILATSGAHRLTVGHLMG